MGDFDVIVAEERSIIRQLLATSYPRPINDGCSSLPPTTTTSPSPVYTIFDSDAQNYVKPAKNSPLFSSFSPSSLTNNFSHFRRVFENISIDGELWFNLKPFGENMEMGVRRKGANSR